MDEEGLSPQSQARVKCPIRAYRGASAMDRGLSLLGRSDPPGVFAAVAAGYVSLGWPPLNIT